MTAPLTRSTATSGVVDSALRHMMVVGGTFRDWADLGDQRWSERVDVLGAEVSRAGGAWLTLRAFEPGADPAELHTWSRHVMACEVVVDPCGDGRQRFADAMRRLDPLEEVNEDNVAAVLYDPADCEPDLVLILGPPTQLPPSLVWELAYAELVFVDIAWHELGAVHVEEAIDDFTSRRRRFGGLDS